MAENDTHYNGTPDTQNMAAEPVIPLPGIGEGGPVYPGDGGNPGQMPVIPLPNPGEGGPVYPGNNNDPGQIPVIPLPNPGEGGPVYPGNGGDSGQIPVIPLPNPGEGGPVYPGDGGDPGQVPVIPLPNPGEGGPVYPGDSGDPGQVPVIPLPNPGEGGPVYPGDSGDPGQVPVIPLPNPGEGGPVYPGNGGGTAWLPGCPSSCCPGSSCQYFGQVRFLNASTNPFTVNISIDSTNYAINSRFGTLTGYDWISDGFHTVTVRRATTMRNILLQQTFPFVANQKVTMVLTDSDSGGLELIRVVDTGCTNLPSGSGCYRFANMSYEGSSVDLLLTNGETVFRDVRFQNVSSYKQAVAGTYQFYVANSNNYAFVRELPIIVIGAIATGSGIRQPLVSFSANITAGKNYTSYLIGNTWSGNSLRVLTVED